MLSLADSAAQTRPFYVPEFMGAPVFMAIALLIWFTVLVSTVVGLRLFSVCIGRASR